MAFSITVVSTATRFTLSSSVGAGFLPGPGCLRQQPFHPFLSDAPAPTGQRGRIDRWAMLKEHLAGEVRVTGALDPPGDHSSSDSR